jgi:hypothetical protein
MRVQGLGFCTVTDAKDPLGKDGGRKTEDNQQNKQLLHGFSLLWIFVKNIQEFEILVKSDFLGGRVMPEVRVHGFRRRPVPSSRFGTAVLLTRFQISQD